MSITEESPVSAPKPAPFNPSAWMIDLKGKDYLPVAARLVWFRQEHPDWGIVTTLVHADYEQQFAVFSASIFNEEGRLISTASKMENIRGFGDYLEKAETGSVGRALAYAGYGTANAPELDEGDERLADAPQGKRSGQGSNGNRSGGQSQNGNGSRQATFSEGDLICHCGKKITAARATMCAQKGITLCCPGQCEQMVGAK